MMNAREYAIRAHGDQMYGYHPYVYHLDEVANYVKSTCPFDYAVDVAYLHDVIEDTSVTYFDLLRDFGEKIANCVLLVTDHEGKNRKERKKLTYHAMAFYSPDVNLVPLTVKLMDRYSNVKNCIETNNVGLLKMYKKEHEDFKTAVYRVGLLTKYQNLLDKMLV